MKKDSATFIMLLHQFIRDKINNEGFIKTFNYCKNLSSNLIFENKQISETKIVKKINHWVNLLLENEEKGNLVSSCISISLLIHLLLFSFNIDSKLHIGVFCVNDETILSHAWVTTFSHSFNYHYDNINYLEILQLDLGEK